METLTPRTTMANLPARFHFSRLIGMLLPCDRWRCDPRPWCETLNDCPVLLDAANPVSIAGRRVKKSKLEANDLHNSPTAGQLDWMVVTKFAKSCLRLPPSDTLSATPAQHAMSIQGSCGQRWYYRIVWSRRLGFSTELIDGSTDAAVVENLLCQEPTSLCQRTKSDLSP